MSTGTRSAKCTPAIPASVRRTATGPGVAALGTSMRAKSPLAWVSATHGRCPRGARDRVGVVAPGAIELDRHAGAELARASRSPPRGLRRGRPGGRTRSSRRDSSCSPRSTCRGGGRRGCPRSRRGRRRRRPRSARRARAGSARAGARSRSRASASCRPRARRRRDRRRARDRCARGAASRAAMSSSSESRCRRAVKRRFSSTERSRCRLNACGT